MKRHEQTSLAIEAGRFFDDVVLVGAEIAELNIDHPDDMPRSTSRQLSSLYDRIDVFRGLHVVYSGDGFVPERDDEGDLATVYKYKNFGKATLKSLYLKHTNDFEYVDPTEIYVPDEDLLYSQVDLVDASEVRLAEFRDSIKSPPDAMRLFVEFLVRKETSLDMPVKGDAVRISEYSVVNIMDAASLEVVYMDESKVQPIVDVHLVDETLFSLSDYYRRQIQHKNFRNSSLQKQKKLTEDFLQVSNTLLGLDRFDVLVGSKLLFIPDENQKYGFELASTSTGFMAHCLRLDCVEASILARNKQITKRKGNFNSYVSMCIVAEVDDGTKDMLGVESNIVWIPLMNQLDGLHFMQDEIL
jgi:hypothetical protein